MKTILFTIYIILATGLLPGQPLPQWSSSISSDFWYINDNPIIKFDNSSNLIVVGTTYSASSSRDIIVIKYAPSGKLLWQQNFNSSYNYYDNANDFAIDAWNNIVITGASVVDSENVDLITIKYDANGNLKWVNRFDGTVKRVDEGKSIAIDPSGTAYVTGYATIDTFDHHQLLVLKIDSSGNTIWNYNYGLDPSAMYHGEKVKIINGHIQVLGAYWKSLNEKSIVIKLDTSGAANFSAESPIIRNGSCFYLDDFGNSYIGHGIWGGFRLTKITPTGSIAWSDTIRKETPPHITGDEVRAIFVDSLEHVYITGRHYSSNADIVTVKYNAAGKRMWVKRYKYQGNNATDIGNAITLDNKLNVYVAGQSQRFSAGTEYDYIVLKYDNNGNEMGSIRYNNPASEDDVITSIVVASDSEIYVTGLTFDNQLSNITTQKYASVNAVGIIELQSKVISLHNFPNPFTKTTTILFSNTDNQLYDFQLFDLNGRIILNLQTVSNKIEISGAHMHSGIYFFTLSNDNHHYAGSIIKTE